MTITDQEVLTEIQGHLIETEDAGATISTGRWTIAEIVGYLNQRQYRLLLETGVLLTRTTIVTIPNQPRHALPQGTIWLRRVLWHAVAGERFELPRADSFQADMAIPDWSINSAPRPRVFMDAELPTLQLQVAPPASDAGVLELLFIELSATLSNTGINFTVPDELVPTCKWGTIADMLSKVGRGQDPARAQIAEGWWQEGVEAVKVMLAGWP